MIIDNINSIIYIINSITYIKFIYNLFNELNDFNIYFSWRRNGRRVILGLGEKHKNVVTAKDTLGILKCPCTKKMIIISMGIKYHMIYIMLNKSSMIGYSPNKTKKNKHPKI